METKAVALPFQGFETKRNSAGQEIGILAGLGSTWDNIDRVGDVAVKGAFADAKPGLPFEEERTTYPRASQSTAQAIPVYLSARAPSVHSAGDRLAATQTQASRELWRNCD